MATTPNFGWVTPAPTDFVTDLPADFETFADAVDADVQLIKNTADAALPETIIDAAGDLIYGSAADTAARLAIGTAGQVLTVNSGATAPEWADPAGGGGAAFSSLATSTANNVSSVTLNISAKEELIIPFWVYSVGSHALSARVNGITSSVYRLNSGFMGSNNTQDNIITNTDQNQIYLNNQLNTTVNTPIWGWLNIKSANQAGYSAATWNCVNTTSGPRTVINTGSALIKTNGPITSVTIFGNQTWTTACSIEVWGGN